MEAVAITGLGLLVPGYSEPENLFKALLKGRSLLRRQAVVNSAGVSAPVQTICAAISDDEMATVASVYPELAAQPLSKATKMGAFAAQRALADAGLDSFVSSMPRLGLFVGSNKNFLHPQNYRQLWQQLADHPPALANDLASLNPGQVATFIAQRHGLQGSLATYGDACAAGATAMVSAYRRIQAGELDVALVGAAEHATQSIFQLIFAKLGALYRAEHISEAEAYRPFDKHRGGCLLADGAAFLVLESASHARARQQPAYAHLVGAHRNSEAHKLTATEPDGSRYAESMKLTLGNAGLRPEQIDHINAHGTATLSNDAAESRAIASVFGDQTSVTSTKSALGHSMAASGAIEAVLCALSLRHQEVLPTLNFHAPLADEPLLNIVTQGQPQSMRYVMSNSFGFGGENAGLIFAAVEG